LDDAASPARALPIHPPVRRSEHYPDVTQPLDRIGMELVS